VYFQATYFAPFMLEIGAKSPLARGWEDTSRVARTMRQMQI